MSINTKAALLAATVLGAATAAPVWAQTSDDAGTGANDIIVTAQRIEQRLQDVPISITVVNQAKLDNNNITNLKDVAQLTPGFAVNNRYGADNTTFTIRGFYQEQRSFATVGVFFNDVVAPRGSGATFGGDGAGPGAMFDLQNVQVLKGPQGTLFGRNVTGGAVLLVPNKPSDKLEGYIEGGAGNYDMWRLQGVVNIPISDSFKIRAGVDHMDRLGYLKNAGNLGDGKFDGRGLGDTNYWAGRLSATLDVSPDIENYTVATYTHSKSNGVIPKVTAAFPGTSNLAYFGNESAAQIAREEPLGFWSVSNRLPDSQSIAETWQVINTLTWTASDSLTVKNILSYGEMRGKTNLDLFGGYSLLPGVTFGSETPGQVRGFAFTANNALAGRTNSQRSMVGELQFQGRPGDGTFTWQAGGYVEINDPIGFSGVQTASFTACDDLRLPSRRCAGWIAAVRRHRLVPAQQDEVPRLRTLCPGQLQADGTADLHRRHPLHLGQDEVRTHQLDIGVRGQSERRRFRLHKPAGSRIHNLPRAKQSSQLPVHARTVADGLSREFAAGHFRSDMAGAGRLQADRRRDALWQMVARLPPRRLGNLRPRRTSGI
jgi:iron complex outermembrane recepter protein